MHCCLVAGATAVESRCIVGAMMLHKTDSGYAIDHGVLCKE